MDFSVTRYSFFEAKGGGSLRFAEHSPPQEEEHEHAICGCTKTAKERPDGEPTDVSQVIETTADVDGRKLYVGLRPSGVEFTFQWEDPNLNDRWDGSKAHAYFWFNPLGKRLQAEVTHKGTGLVNCLLGKVFFGNNVDISTLMNGHSPSRIIDLSTIDPNAVWSHDCSWGKEAVEMFQDCKETETWREYDKRATAIYEVTNEILRKDLSVDEIRRMAESNTTLQTNVGWIREWLTTVLRDFEKTELYRACNATGTRVLEPSER